MHLNSYEIDADCTADGYGNSDDINGGSSNDIVHVNGDSCSCDVVDGFNGGCNLSIQSTAYVLLLRWSTNNNFRVPR